jgi:hypothetical protein
VIGTATSAVSLIEASIERMDLPAAAGPTRTRLRRRAFAVLVVAAAGLSGWLAWGSVRVGSASVQSWPRERPAPDAEAQLANIKRRLPDEAGTMQVLFPEGWFFSHILYGYAWVNLGLLSDSAVVRAQAAREARWVLRQVDTPEGFRPFKEDTQVRRGVFYLGWTNRLLGGLLKLEEPALRSRDEVSRHRAQSQELARAFLASPHATLDAYPGQAWPCDQTVALASLVLHDELHGAHSTAAVRRWVEHARSQPDPATALLPHQVDSASGRIKRGSRGSSQVYLLAFLPEIDAGLARAHYARFRELFVVRRLGFLAVREYPRGRFGVGDVDSGPVVLGVGPTATMVSLAAARANGDRELFESSATLLEALGVPREEGGEKSYAFGRLLVLDAFAAWGKSLTPWTRLTPATYSERPFRPDPGAWHRGALAGTGVAWGGVACFALLRRQEWWRRLMHS